MKGNIELKEKYIEYYGDVPIQRYAAMHIGRNEDTIIIWKKEDSDFSERVEAKKAQWVRSKVTKAKVEFALERIEKEVFTEKTETDVTIIEPVPILSKPIHPKDVQSNDSPREDTEANKAD